METDWILDRTHLWQLHLEHPDWGAKKLARHTERSLTWVKKWRRRLRGADPDDETVLQSRSRARKTSPKKVCQTVIDRILAIRDEPPDNLRRTPGPKTILYFLERDRELRQQQVYLPRSTRTIWQILRQHGRIFRSSPPEPEPEERPEPMSEWGIDFKDVSSVPPEPDGRRWPVMATLPMDPRANHLCFAGNDQRLKQTEPFLLRLHCQSKMAPSHRCPGHVSPFNLRGRVTQGSEILSTFQNLQWRIEWPCFRAATSEPLHQGRLMV